MRHHDADGRVINMNVEGGPIDRAAHGRGRGGRRGRIARAGRRRRRLRASRRRSAPLGRARANGVGRALTFYVHTHVREDALLLFAFATPEDKAAFRTLIGVSNVGPKMALALLSAMPADELAAPCGAKDLAKLVAVPGIGKKTAERLLARAERQARADPSGSRRPPRDGSRPRRRPDARRAAFERAHPHGLPARTRPTEPSQHSARRVDTEPVQASFGKPWPSWRAEAGPIAPP